jgi:hypothetical protein
MRETCIECVAELPTPVKVRAYSPVGTDEPRVIVRVAGIPEVIDAGLKEAFEMPFGKLLTLNVTLCDGPMAVVVVTR